MTRASSDASVTLVGDASLGKRLGPRHRDLVERGWKINVEERRTFSIGDFKDFPSPGAFRTAIYRINSTAKEKLITCAYVSNVGFYVVRGSGLDPRTVTPLPTVDRPHQLNLVEMLLALGDEVACVHDLHLTFDCPAFYDTLQLVPDNSSKDKRLMVKRLEKSRTIGVTAHDTGTVSVRMGCSTHPFPRDNLTELFFVLERVRNEILVKYVHDPLKVPLVADWIVVRWDYNKDGAAISSERFQVTLAGLSDTLYQFYAKRFEEGVVRPRLEKVETPTKTLRELAKEALG